MAFLGGLLGGGSDSADIYGDLFTEKQRAALRDQQMTDTLLRLSAGFAKAGQASRLPTGGLLGAIGEAAGGLAGHGDEASERMLKAMQTAEAVKKAQQSRRFDEMIAPFYKKLVEKELGLGLPPGTLTKDLVPAAAAPSASGAPPGGPPASNAPPPPPISAPNAADYGVGAGGIPGVGRDADLGISLPPPPPPQAAGLLPPSGDDPWAQYAGLLGGGTGSQVPFDLSTLDPTAQGSPDRPIRIEQLSGEAAPVLASERMRETAPVPSLGGRALPASAWEVGTRYDRGDTPFDPARPYATPQQFAAPPSELDRLSQLMKVETVAKPPAAATANLTGSNWEIANNNFGGMRRPGVNATPSQGGFQTFATPEAGLGAISNQLDRYASGATTGKPLSTIREIVSTWAPPSENDTEALIKRASRVMGVADNIPLNIGDPAVKAKLIEATVRNEQGGKLPVDPALIGQVANAPPGTYAASTGGGRGFSGRIEPLGSDAAPAGAAPSGKIPGLDISPQGLAALNALTKMAGHGDVFSSLLETYYKSPGYLEEKARTEAQAQKDVAFKMDPLIQAQVDAAKAKVDLEWKPKIEEAVQKLQSPILKEREQAKADIARYSEELKINQTAAVTPTDATIVGPGGVLTDTKILASELVQRQQARADRIARGDTSIQPGDIVGKPVGAAPAEHQYIMTPQGTLSAVPVPGTPAAEKAAETANKKLQTEQQKLIGRDVVVREVDNIGKLMESAIFPTTGFVGSMLQNLGGTSANDVRVARQTLESRLSADALNAQRAASPTGAAFGNTSDTDVAILRTALVNLDQSQTKEQFKDRLQILKQAYVDVVHGPGMSRLLPETPVLKQPATTTATPSGPPRERRWNPQTNRLE